MTRVQARKAAISGQVARWTRGMAQGYAELHGIPGPRAGSNRRTNVSVGGERLSAPRIFINVGGRARVPDLPGVGEVPFLT